MCGIVAVVSASEDGKISDELVQALPDMAKRIHHRGPDAVGTVVDPRFLMAQTRLSIVDISERGDQPFRYAAPNDAVLVFNGEIYNHKDLRKKCGDFPFIGESDGEVIVPLLQKEGLRALGQLDGIFGLACFVDGEVVVARDSVGVKPLIYGKSKYGDELLFSSEMKAISEHVTELQTFPPGSYWTRKSGFQTYYKPDWFTAKPKLNPTSKEIFEKMEDAVKKRLMADVPLGCFISGGLDSSLVASFVRRLLGPDAEIHSFSVCVEGSNSGDRKYSRKVAEHLNTIHHEAVFTIAEGLDMVDKLIYHLESWDVCPIRSGIAMSFLCKLAAQYVKVVLTGEGADEVWAGYAYLADTDDGSKLQAETVRKIRELHEVFLNFDDKIGMMHSLELRVPFLDLSLLDFAMSIDPKHKLHAVDDKPRMEKYILRDACEIMLPDDVIWRRKEQFGDGVGYMWIDTLKNHWNDIVSDDEFAQREQLFPDHTPQTKEAFHYRKVFHKHFPQRSAANCVTPWYPWSDKANYESSGRVQKSHSHQE